MLPKCAPVAVVGAVVGAAVWAVVVYVLVVEGGQPSVLEVTPRDRPRENAVATGEWSSSLSSVVGLLILTYVRKRQKRPVSIAKETY